MKILSVRHPVGLAVAFALALADRPDDSDHIGLTITQGGNGLRQRCADSDPATSPSHRGMHQLGQAKAFRQKGRFARVICVGTEAVNLSNGNPGVGRCCNEGFAREAQFSPVPETTAAGILGLPNPNDTDLLSPV
jgi:hypothetical protein